MRDLVPPCRSVLWAWVAVAGCASPCEELATRFCSTCEDLAATDSAVQVDCRCVEQGSLARDDGPEGYFASDADAAIACDRILLGLRYVGEDGAAACGAGNALLKDEGTDACEFVTVPAFLE